VQHQEEHGRQRDAPLQQPPSPAYVRDAGDYDVAHRDREQIQHARDRQPLAADQFHACKKKQNKKNVKKNLPNIYNTVRWANAAREILTQHETAKDDAHANESQDKSQHQVQLKPRTYSD